MAAYLIFLCTSVEDWSELEEYWETVNSTFDGREIKVLSLYETFEVLEGDQAVEGIVLVEFPSFADAKDWYDSPAYREVREHRFRGAKYLGMIAQGGAVPRENRMLHLKQKFKAV